MQRQNKSTVFLALMGFLGFSVLLVFLQNFHGHWMEREQRAARARLYLQSDVCTNARLRIQLGPEATCAQKEMELRITPLNRAIFDVLEDFSLCGHRRCEAMVQWVLHWKWLFLGLAGLIAWFYVQYFFMTYHVHKMRNWQEQLCLPGGGIPQHLHVD
jgi:hypothetical protein